jgi:hypothetical protein
MFRVRVYEKCSPASKPEAQAEGIRVLSSTNRIPSARASGFEDMGSAQHNVETRARGFLGTPAPCGGDRYPLSGLKTENLSHHRPGRPIRYNLSNPTGSRRWGRHCFGSDSRPGA